MNKYGLIGILLALVYTGQAQLLSPQQEKIDSLIMAYIGESQVTPDPMDFQKTQWKTLDPVGGKFLKFSGGKSYVLKIHASNGKTISKKGKWYVYDKYIVLVDGKDKMPLYVIRDRGRIVLLDEENLAIMKTLIMGFVTGDQWMGYLTKKDVLGFLNGFEKHDS